MTTRIALLVAAIAALACLSPATVAAAPGTTAGIQMMPGFPVDIGAERIDPDSRSVVLADLDGDQDLEVVYATTACRGSDIACGTGLLLAWDHQGVPLPGFPITTVGQAFYSPSVGDLDRDGDQEIVLATVEIGVGFHLYVIEHDGSTRPGFPILEEYAGNGYTTLYDLDSDGFLEIIWSEPSALSVFESDGSEWTSGWPVALSPQSENPGRIAAPPTVGDVDGDDSSELVVWTQHDQKVHVLSTDGHELPGWPLTITDDSLDAYDCEIVLADLDHDPGNEIIMTIGRDQFVSTNRLEVHVFRHDTSELAGWPKKVEQGGGSLFPMAISMPLVTDLEGDGTFEILIATSTSQNASQRNLQVFAWDASGAAKDGFPYRPRPAHRICVITMLTAADANGDGRMEVFGNSYYTGEPGNPGGYIVGFDASGVDLPGFPIRTPGSTLINGATIGDVDHDGDYEIAVTGFVYYGLDHPDNRTQVYLYDLPGSCRASDSAWPTYRANNQRDGQQKSPKQRWRDVRGMTRIGRIR